MTDRKEPIVDLDGLEAAVRANQLQPANANGGNVAATMSAIVDQALLPESITRLCDGMAHQFGATANMMRNNAQHLRLRADQLDQMAEHLENSRKDVTKDLKDLIGMERRAYQINQSSALGADQIAPETPRPA